MTALLVDLVILAGGQGSRMGGANKLLQCFDDQPQLLKIISKLQHQVGQCWVNSHRDHEQYRALVSEVQCFSDTTRGFCGPLAGMSAAWSFVAADYVLFVPCDITWIPEQLLSDLLTEIVCRSAAQVVYASINGDALYPLCLMRRSASQLLQQQLEQQQFSVHRCFYQLNAGCVAFVNPQPVLHSINSFAEKERYRQSVA